MTITTRLQFDLPDTAPITWATNANRTLDPADTLADPVPIVQADGWELNQRPPAKVMNWIHHYLSEWLRSTSLVPLSSWRRSDDAGASNIDGICYANDYWVISSGTATYYSRTGDNWTAGGALTSAANKGAFTIDSTREAIFGTANGLEYSANGGTSFTQVLDATIGGGFSGGAIAMDTNIDAGDRTIVVDGNGVTRIAPSGVAGAWAAPTTPPVLGATPGTIGRVIYAGGGKWFACRRAATTQHLSRSVDDGDNWTTRNLPAFTSNNVYSIAYDPASGRLVTCGVGAVGVNGTQYSDDDGATWTASSGSVIEPYSCGGGLWAGSTDQGSTGTISISRDNAATFRKLPEVYPASLFYPMSDGSKLIIIGGTGVNIMSLSYPDFR